MSQEQRTPSDGASQRRGELEDMDETGFEAFVRDALLAHAHATGASPMQLETYREVGIVTDSKGLVVRVGKIRFVLNLLRDR